MVLGQEQPDGAPSRISRSVVVEAHAMVVRLLDHWTANKIIEEDTRDASKHVKGYKKLNEI